jgi:serine protease Do
MSGHGTSTESSRPSAPRQCRRPRGLAAWLLLALVGLCLAGPSLPADEVSGLQAASAIEQSMIDVIARCERSVVAIARVRREDTEQLGPEPGKSDFIPNEYATGVVIDAHGLILTNNHVLGADEFDASLFYVTTIDRKTYPAKVKAADPRSDLAVLEIAASDLSPIKFGNASTLKKGQIVIALGNPYAIARDGQVSASWGIVSNLGRKLGPIPTDVPGESKPTLHHFGTLIQTDAKLNLGTSGGALLNLKGEMIGLTTSLAALAGYEQSAGYAIPVDETFLRVIETLKQGREAEYGFLGVAPLDLEAAEILRGAYGARVNGVVLGTPADRADLRRGDVVIAVDGQAVHDVDSLMLAVGRLPVDSVVRLAVLRDTGLVELTPRLAKFPVRGRKIVTAPAPNWRGLSVEYLTAILDMNARGNLPTGEAGVVVSAVREHSPASQANIQPGTIITHAAGARVESPSDFFDAVKGRSGPVELRIWIAPDARPTVRVEDFAE